MQASRHVSEVFLCGLTTHRGYPSGTRSPVSPSTRASAAVGVPSVPAAPVPADRRHVLDPVVAAVAEDGGAYENLFGHGLPPCRT